MSIFFLFLLILFMVIIMDNVDVRKYIINNFKDDDVNEIEKAISSSIESLDDDILVGLGVLFEVMWKCSNDEEKTNILSNIKKGLK